MVQRGRELGYKITDEQFNGYPGQHQEESKIETEEQFQAALKRENMTLGDLRKNIERDGDRVARPAERSPGEGDGLGRRRAKMHCEHKDEFTTPQEITLREIFVSVPGDGTTINVGLDEEARGPRSRRFAGASSAATASRSWRPTCRMRRPAPTRGLIGPLSVNDLSPELKKLVSSMKVG